MKPTKDYILRDLIDFFLDGLSEDPAGVGDWIAQGDFLADDFIPAVQQLRKELELRGFDAAPGEQLP